MKFHLQFPIHPFQEKINYHQSMMFLGSCFADNIGELLKQHKFNVFTNPNGIVYNPASIAISLRKYMKGYTYNIDDLFYANEVWSSWEHHSAFDHTNKNEALTKINNSYSKATSYLKSADWLFITFGSAYYYRRTETGQVVSNCHKIDQSEFTKQLMNVPEIVKEYNDLLLHLKSYNPNLKIVFSISPVRYKRDGVIENNRSKACLIESVHQLIEIHEDTYYFPAYELVIDDLRDYRFFKEDLVHPNQQAINYVFEKFAETVFENQTKVIVARVKQLIADQNHKLQNGETNATKKFIQESNQRRQQLINEFPFLVL